MSVLDRASLGFLLRHPWQLGLALLGIAVGVAVIVAVDLANTSSRKAFLLSLDAVNGQATHQIVGGPRGVDERLYARLRLEDGARSIAPVVEGRVDVGGASLTVLGVDVLAERDFRAYTAPGASSAADDGGEFAVLRRFMTEPGAVLMSARTAALIGRDPGERFPVVAAGIERQAVLLGLLGAGDDARLDNLLIVDVATAQEWLDRVGWLSRIDVRLRDDAAVAEWRTRLPPGVQLLTAAGRTQTTSEMTSAFMTNLTAMSLLALLVGVFLIYNSVGFAVVQRRGLIGVLRALGLTRAEVYSLILREGVVLGVVGAGLGVAAGIWLGDRLLLLVSQSINDLYFRLTVTDVAVDGWSIAKGFGAGLGATLVAAAVPAYEAAGVGPTLSMTRSALERSTGRLVPWLALAGLGGVAAALGVLEMSGDGLVAGLTALFMVILGFALCIPLGVRLLSTGGSALAARLGGTPARLAVDGIGASLSRTGVAIVALAVAVSATVGVSVMVDSFRGAVSDWLGRSLQSDIYVGVRSGSLDPAVLADVARIDGVRAMSTRRLTSIETDGGRTRVIALALASDADGGTELVALGDGLSADDVWRSFRDGDAVLVSDPYAYRNRVAPGDRVALRTDSGPRSFEIAAVYRSYDANQGAVLMSRTTYDRHWADTRVDSVGLYLDAGTADTTVMDRVRELSEGRQSLLVSSNAALRDVSLRIFDRTFVITDVLYWLAVGVAMIGILGAMLALQLENGRELAVLRALGMTPGQLGAMVTLQTAVIGLLSGLAAIPLGVVMAWMLIDVINRRSFGWQMDMTVDPAILLSAVALAAGSAMVAGLYPAYRAANSSPAAAMREE